MDAEGVPRLRGRRSKPASYCKVVAFPKDHVAMAIKDLDDVI
jgi:hypothetical protein